MTLSLVQVGGVIAMGYDTDTGERGWLLRFTNRTGHTSVKGELVSASTATDKEVVLQASEYDVIGVVAEAGIAEAADVWVWTAGSRCRVLFKDGSAATRGNILVAADTDGRAIDIANPGQGAPATETHFKECGHVLESTAAGTNVLALASIHFN